MGKNALNDRRGLQAEGSGRGKMSSYKIAAVSLALVCASLGVSACERSEVPSVDEAPTANAIPAPVTVEKAALPELSPEQLTALAFRAAWGGPPPIERTETHEGQTDVRTYRSGKLVPLGNARFALITGGQGSEGHVHAGSLAVHYLTRTADGFERTGSWPGLLVSGTWGAPPDWSIRTDLTPSPTLVVEAGGTWQGYTCSWAHLVELTPTRPVIRVDQISTGYGSGGALGDAGESVEGRIIPGRKGETIRVQYTGDRTATVTYAKVGEVYDPVDLPELPGC